MSGPIWSNGKRDANEPAIRRVVEREFGGRFQAISIKDGPDAIVGFAGKTELWEIKNGAKRLRPGQERWASSWPGGTVVTVRNEAQARKRLRIMGAPSPLIADVLRAQHEEALRSGAWEGPHAEDSEGA